MIKEAAEKEVNRIAPIVKNLKLTNNDGRKLLELVNSYFGDAEYFFRTGKFLQAFEAAVICWAYIDAGLHLKAFTVPEKFAKTFTI